MTLYYIGFFFIMLITGILMYDQPLITKKKGKILKALQQIGWMLMSVAILGALHGILSLLGLIQTI